MSARPVLALGLAVLGCAAPLRTSVAPFRAPAQLPNATQVWSLIIAADPLDTPERSSRVFGTDLGAADILALQLVVENRGSEEYEIDAAQIFGIAGSEYYPAYNLSQAAQRVRESSIGSTVAAQAVLGALAGAAAGAAIGAAAGAAAGNTGRGAASGAAIGTAVGGTAGATEGASDRYTHQFRHELAAQDFGDRVIFRGDLHQGFIYFQRQPYRALRVKVTNVTARETRVVEMPLTLARRPTP